MSGDKIRVVIVDDERLFAELLRVALRGAEGIEVLAVAHDVRTAIAVLNELRPDVVLADYHLPDGTGADLARAIRGSLPDTAVLVLTADPSAVTLNDVARSGAVGHLTKERGFAEVVESVRSAAAGEILFAPSELQRLLLESAATRKEIEPLTARELEVLRLLAGGTSTSSAAESLGSWFAVAMAFPPEVESMFAEVCSLVHQGFTSRMTFSSTAEPSGRLATPKTSREETVSSPKTSRNNSEAASATKRRRGRCFAMTSPPTSCIRIVFVSIG